MNAKDREKLIMDNTGVVGIVAKKAWGLNYVRKSLGTFEDAFQIGMVGLCKAADKFDPTRLVQKGPTKGKPVKFGSYAGITVWNEITRTAISNSIIALPEIIAKKKKNANLKYEELAKKALSTRYIEDVQIDPRDRRSLSVPDKIHNREVFSILNEHISKLDDRQQRVIKTYFHFPGFKGPGCDLSADLGITRQRVQQVKCEAILKLKKSLESSLIEELYCINANY
ncbi:sigma-70 family RNA polymerase sigma factor [Candidatus Parcubacteria bacterium]|nr:MAG: sigma-70 family RNA polymerase sigma factor [Candidatus Parcubacteria bacterium]